MPFDSRIELSQPQRTQEYREFNDLSKLSASNQGTDSNHIDISDDLLRIVEFAVIIAEQIDLVPSGCQRLGDLLDPFRRWKFTVVYEADFHRARQSARTWL